MAYPFEMNGEWVRSAMELKGVNGPLLAKLLTDELGRSFDRSTINKMVQDKRDVAADEMLAISRLTGKPIPGLLLVPLLSFVSAGQLRDSSSQVEAENVPLLTFPDLGRGEYFALKVEGDSMDRISPEGSIIVVNRADTDLRDGLFYVFWSERAGATFKRWRPFPARLEPYSTNPTQQPIYLLESDEPHVIGRVVVTTLEL